MQKLSGQAVERESHNRDSVQKDRKSSHKADHRDLNHCPLLSIVIQIAVDISSGLVIDKPEPFRYTVL